MIVILFGLAVLQVVLVAWPLQAGLGFTDLLQGNVSVRQLKYIKHTRWSEIIRDRLID